MEELYSLDDLIAAIFQRAVADLEQDGLTGDSAREFLRPSGWARFLLESIGVDPDLVDRVGAWA